MLFDHGQREASRAQLAFGMTPCLVRSGVLVLFEQNRILAVEADVLTPISGKSLIKLLKIREIQVSDAGTHVGLIGYVAPQRLRTGPNSRVQSKNDRQLLAQQ